MAQRRKTVLLVLYWDSRSVLITTGMILVHVSMNSLMMFPVYIDSTTVLLDTSWIVCSLEFQFTIQIFSSDVCRETSCRVELIS